LPFDIFSFLKKQVLEKNGSQCKTMNFVEVYNPKKGNKINIDVKNKLTNYRSIKFLIEEKTMKLIG